MSKNLLESMNSINKAPVSYRSLTKKSFF